MEVVGYLNQSDLLLEDEQGVAVIGGSSYVLSVGDKVYIEQPVNQDARVYAIKISFAHAAHSMLHEDQIQIKFSGCRDSLQQYMQQTTVH
ncbi:MULTISPECIES: hypothetical protein [unclassified Acinetobacter]|uniref:hypothetical protein n=1 Tax=unclassified Acinetobacter TaxID=196816 RepID=UPI00293491D0|nr:MULTISPECIES: hypothetical protein [unclassified Acinetobacter]WOE32560.1 hypothetical protein QSG84_05025 [Acinetobacter sp. SAAs470]WOE38035.1 hypothetical protein QSG86_14080 [Acinetobacter sp. SAAs474]